MDMLRVPSHHYIDIRDGDAWKQVAIDALVHGHASFDVNEENIFSSGAAASAAVLSFGYRHGPCLYKHAPCLYRHEPCL